MSASEVNDGSSEVSKENGSEQQHLPRDHSPNTAGERTRKPAKGSEPFEKREKDEMERLLKQLNGHLGNLEKKNLVPRLAHLPRYSYISYPVSGE